MIAVNHPYAIERLTAATGVIYNPAADQCIAYFSDRLTPGSKLLGGVIYQEFTQESIRMHTAGFSPTWLSRQMLFAAFYYPFVTLKCARAFATIPEWNEPSIRLAERLGFTFHVKIDGVFTKGALMVYVMERHECRWVDIYRPLLTRRLPDGEVRSAAAA